MAWRTPRSWYRRRAPAGLLWLLATPASRLWAAASARRVADGARFDPGVPVICVGNLTLGGEGKTPIARELVRWLGARGLAAAILTRGHAGRLKGPIEVDPTLHSAHDVGDEALMLAKDASVWVARDRAAGAQAAVAAGARLIVMDDGHQNGGLRKLLSLVVVDGETRDGAWPFGDGSVFPAGPLREPLDQGLARADAVVLLLPADLAEPDPELLAVLDSKPILIARLVPERPPPPARQLAFAGIGKPWKFQRALAAAGAELVDFVPLADHQPLTEPLLAGLARRAGGAGLITTEKDAARLPPAWRAKVSVWPVRAVFDDQSALAAVLAPALS
jgi:tetraacyldisaccharide 4'-kinase